MKDGNVQKLETNSSRLPTEESQISRDSKESKPETIKSSKSSFKSEEKSTNPHINRSKGREGEVKAFIQNIQDHINSIPSLETQFAKEKNQLQTNLKQINEKIQEFTGKVVKLLQEQTEEMMTGLNVEFGREMLRISSFSEKLKNTSKGLQEIVTDIESNYQRILHNIDERPYRMIMDKYMERMPNFEKFFASAKNFHLDYTKFLPTEKIAHFKRCLKATINETFTGFMTKTEAPRLSYNSKHQKEIMSSQVHEIAPKPELEVLLRSEESEVSGQSSTAMKNVNHMIISFENKEIFQNALQSSMEPMITMTNTRNSETTMRFLISRSTSFFKVGRLCLYIL